MNSHEKKIYVHCIHYGYFDWIDYVNKNPKTNLNSKLTKKEDIYSEYIKEESKKKNPIYFNIKKNEGSHFFKYNNLHISFEEFPWESYIIMNDDLKKIGLHHFSFETPTLGGVLSENGDTFSALEMRKGVNSKEIAWNHWIHHGKKEERPFSLINNINTNKGRFGNLFFVNMYLHFLAIKYDLKCNYKYEEKFKKLGIFFHCGNKMYNKNLLVTENNYLTLLENNFEPGNIIITNDNWYQSKLFCLIIQNYFDTVFGKKEQIINQNIFKNRYGKNNDLFIHVRLGDISDKTQFLLPYYEKMLSTSNFEKGYISSDSIDSYICKILIQKYNLEVVNYSDIETIMFGCTCNNIILSGGSFSWLIGFLAFNSNYISYPDTKRFEKKWFGNIFNYTNWNCITNF
jgi:hypothetical protein